MARLGVEQRSSLSVLERTPFALSLSLLHAPAPRKKEKEEPERDWDGKACTYFYPATTTTTASGTRTGAWMSVYIARPVYLFVYLACSIYLSVCVYILRVCGVGLVVCKWRQKRSCLWGGRVFLWYSLQSCVREAFLFPRLSRERGVCTEVCGLCCTLLLSASVFFVFFFFFSALFLFFSLSFFASLSLCLSLPRFVFLMLSFRPPQSPTFCLSVSLSRSLSAVRSFSFSLSFLFLFPRGGVWSVVFPFFLSSFLRFLGFHPSSLALHRRLRLLFLSGLLSLFILVSLYPTFSG